MNNEKKTLLLAIISLILSLIVVYFVFLNSNYGKKTLQLLSQKKVEETQTTSLQTNNTQIENLNDNTGNQNIETGTDNNTGFTGQNAVNTGLSESGSDNSFETVQDYEAEKQKYLSISGVLLYRWKLNILEPLKLDRHFILDYDGSKFVYISGYDEKEVFEAIKKIGGKTLEITKKNDILEKQLVGDKVVFVSLPEYEGKLVFFIIYFEKYNQHWLVRVKPIKYQKVIDFLKVIFKDLIY